jgi:hypothetical protein
MIRAFIVKVDVTQPFALMDIAADIEDALDKQGIPVDSVVPWKGHGIIQAPTPITPMGPQPPSV